jgi:hypothetical protein
MASGSLWSRALGVDQLRAVHGVLALVMRKG